MIGAIAPAGGSFADALAYALRLKAENKRLSREELAEKFPAVTSTPDDPGWTAGARHRVIGGNMSGETERELRREFAAVRNLRPNIKNPAISLSVRKAPGDAVSLQTWEEIAERTIEGLGLQGCPFLVIQHRDKDDHIHIIASRIRLDGKVISDSQSYEKVEQVMREVEVKYGFECVQGSRETYDRAPTWWEHKLLQEKGTLSPKLAMQARISAVLEDRPTTTQFISRLREAHGIEAIFKLGEDEVPCGVAFRYRDVTMSGGALGRGYTWKKLQERGLTYDERDIEAIERTREGARPYRQQIADQERTVSRTPRTISDARGGAVHDPPSGGTLRAAIVELDGREIQSQQYATRPSAPRGDQQSNQAGLSEAKANIAGSGGEDPSISHESIAAESLTSSFTTLGDNKAAINFHPDTIGHTNPGFICGPRNMEQSAASAGGNRLNIEAEYTTRLAGANRVNSPLDVGGGARIRTAGANTLDNPSTPDFNTSTDGFRDELRDAIREMDDYMQDYWQENAQYQAAITIEPIEFTETSVEVEMEAEAIFEELIIL